MRPRIGFPGRVALFAISILGFTSLLVVGCDPRSDPDEAAPEEGRAAATADSGATAEPSLPSFEPCDPATPPTLPEKWAADGFMQGFGEQPVQLGRFTFDETANAYRVALSTPDTNPLDFLLVGDALYLLTGSYDDPTGCDSLGPFSFGLPTRQVLSEEAVCVGEAKILGQEKQWWKDSSSTTPGADWYWFGTDADRSLFRMMPYGPIRDMGLPGLFAFTYFPSFESLDQTDLPALVELCGASPQADAAPAAGQLTVADAEATLRELLSSGGDAADAAGDPLVSGVAACDPGDRPPPWPTTLQGTVLLTAVNIKYSPFPSLVRYDTEVPGLRTDMYNPWPPTNETWNEYSARLVSETGYSIYLEDETITQCVQNLPGPPVPTWMEADECSCQAVLDPGSTLNPSDEPYLVMRCPLTASATTPQVFWTWYGADSGQPTVFMQTNSSAAVGTGLNLADYYDWQPGASIDPSIYDIPTACDGQPKQPVPVQCHNCHLPLHEQRIESDEPIKVHVPLGILD